MDTHRDLLRNSLTFGETAGEPSEGSRRPNHGRVNEAVFPPFDG